MVLERTVFVVGSVGVCQITEPVIQMDGNIQTICFKNFKSDI